MWFARAGSRFFSGFLIPGSHWVAHVRSCVCVSLSWYRHTQLVFRGGLAPLAAKRVDGTGTEEQGGHLLSKCALAHFAAKRPKRPIWRWSRNAHALHAVAPPRCIAERGAASSDKGKLSRAAQELLAQAPTSAHSAMGPYKTCSGRCYAAEIVMMSAASLRAIRASSFELPKSFKLKRAHRRNRPWGRELLALHAVALPR